MLTRILKDLNVYQYFFKAMRIWHLYDLVALIRYPLELYNKVTSREKFLTSCSFLK